MNITEQFRNNIVYYQLKQLMLKLTANFDILARLMLNLSKQ